MLILHNDHKSYASQKVLVYLAEKEIKFDNHNFDLTKQEHILDNNYRYINPQVTVPALQDGATTICNSTEIMEYVSNKYLDKSDVFFDATLAPAIHDFCKKDELLHDPHLRILSYSKLWFAKEKSTEEINRLLAMAAKHPNKVRGAFLARAAQGNFTLEEIQLANTAIINAMLDMEKKLSISQSNFIFGTKYTMADTVCTVRLFRFGQLSIKIEALQDECPHTDAFYQRMKERKSYCQLQI